MNYASQLRATTAQMHTLLALCGTSESSLLKFSFDDGPAKKVKAVRPVLTEPLKKAMQQLQQYGEHKEGLESALRSIPNTPRAKSLKADLSAELKDLESAYKEAAEAIMAVAQSGMPKALIDIATEIAQFLKTEYKASGLVTQPTVWVSDEELYYGTPLTFNKLGAEGDPYTVGLIAHISPDDTMKMYVTGDRGKVHLTSLAFDSTDLVATAAQAVKRLKYHLEVDDVARQQGMVLPFGDQKAVVAKIRELGPHVVDITTTKQVMRVVVDRKKSSDRENLLLALGSLVGEAVMKTAYFHISEKVDKWKGKPASVYDVRLLKRINASDRTLLNRALDVRDTLDLDDDEYRGLLDFIRTRKR